MVGVGSCVHMVFPKAKEMWKADKNDPSVEKVGAKEGEELLLAVTDIPKTRGMLERSAKRSISGHQGIGNSEELANANKRLAVSVGFDASGFGNLSACLRPGAASGSACHLSSAALTDLSMQSMTNTELNLKVAAGNVEDIDMPQAADAGNDIESHTGNAVKTPRTRLDLV